MAIDTTTPFHTGTENLLAGVYNSVASQMTPQTPAQQFSPDQNPMVVADARADVLHQQAKDGPTLGGVRG